MTLSTFYALRGYGAVAATPPRAGEGPARPIGEDGSGAPFAVAQTMVAALAGAEKQSQALIAGAADPHSVIQALAQAELAVETAAVIRDKVVEAYQEILRMPV